jgi:SAM-dependent methyltransferase
MQRRPTHELLDDDSGTPKEVADSLLDLRWFNRWFGGIATTRTLIQTAARKTGKSEFSLLEVAAGDGSLMQAVCTSLRSTGIRLKVTLLDRAPSHLPAFANSNHSGDPSAGATEACVGRTYLSDAVDGVRVDSTFHDQNQKRRTRTSDPHEHLDPHMPSAFSSAVVADALNLPFPDSAFDLISCSLFVHHLSPDQSAIFARECLRVCRHAALVHDLVRNPLHLAFAYAGMPLYRSRLTRNDAPASVRQAYTIEEMERFFRAAGAPSVDARKHYFYRMGVIAWKNESRPPA